MTKPPFTFRQIDHVVIKAKDMDMSLSFYRDILGAELERELPEIGLKQLRAGSSLIDLVPQTGDVSSHNMEHFALTITPFHGSELIDYLTQKGVPCGDVERRYGAEGYGPSLYLTDPDGNIVELKGPPEK